MLLKDQVAIITGGTRGIGFAIARSFLEQGAAVIVCGSRPQTAQAAVEKLRAENSAWSVEGISPDLSDYASVQAAFDDVVARYHRVDILVNNAGTSASEPLTGYTPEMFRKTMSLNLDATFYCIRAIVPHMIQRHSGCILNTSSMVSIYGQPAGVAYPTSKAAVNGMTLSLARELGPHGIRVNAVAPGITNTDMMQAVPKSVIEPMIAQIPLRRIGEPEDVANAFVFLASPMASYITGEVLRVDGLARS